MSTLTPRDKTLLEELLDMSDGYVLDFSDATFASFFGSFDIDIHSEKYRRYGTSKAKKLRAFWDIEPEALVGRVVLGLVEHKEALKARMSRSFPDTPTEGDDTDLIAQCNEIANRLCSGTSHLHSLKQTAKEFDAHYLADQIQRMEKAVIDDPELAIGTSKELVETCCKTILETRGQTVDGSATLGKLSKATMKELKLLPDEVPDSARGSETVKRLLQNLATVTQGLAEIRNLYGTGHGRHGKSKGISKRHARLAVGAATTYCRFLWDTHEETKSD